MTNDKYMIVYKDELGNGNSPCFADWDDAACHIKDLDERKIPYKLCEKQGKRWIEILNSEGTLKMYEQAKQHAGVEA